MSYKTFRLANLALMVIALLGYVLFPGHEHVVTLSAGTVWTILAGMRLRFLGWTLWRLLPCALAIGLGLWGGNGEDVKAMVVAGNLYTAVLSVLLLAYNPDVSSC